MISIRTFREVIGAPLAGALRRHIVLLVVYGMAQGVVFLLLVPLLRAILAGDTATAWTWLGGFAGAVLVTGVLYYVQAMAGYSVGLTISRALHHRIGDHVSALPIGWFEGGKLGSLSRLASVGVQDVMGISAHLLKPSAS